MDSKPKIVVIGGGIIGCSIDWQLARKGAKVTLIERGQPGEEASGAATRPSHSAASWPAEAGRGSSI
jgi:glycine/D-amino acid oxidase-like deaminating enzyme